MAHLSNIHSCTCCILQIYNLSTKDW